MRTLTWKCASRHNGVQFCISHLARLHTRRFTEPTFLTLRSPKSWEKHSVSRLSYLFAHLDLLSSETRRLSLFDILSSSLLFSSLLFSDFSYLCFSSVHIVGSLTSKLPSTTTLHNTTLHYTNYNITTPHYSYNSTTLQLQLQLRCS